MEEVVLMNLSTLAPIETLQTSQKVMDNLKKKSCGFIKSGVFMFWVNLSYFWVGVSGLCVESFSYVKLCIEVIWEGHSIHESM